MMKHELENLKPEANVRQISLKDLFTKLSSRELTENIILFLISRICFMDYMISPFGVTLYSVLFFRGKRPSYVLFAVLGIFSSGMPLFYFKYIGSLLITMSIQLIFAKELVHKRRLAAAVTALAVFLNGVVYVLLEGFFVFDTLLLLFECAVSFVAFFVFDKAVNALRAYTYKHTADPIDVICITLLLSTVVLSLSFTQNFWPIAHVVSVFFILFLSLTYGFGMCTPAGAVFGIALGFNTAFPAQIVCIYTISSLLSGLFGRYGRLAVSGAFTFSSLITTLLLCPEANGILTVSYVAAACLILFFVPDRALTIMAAAANKPRKEALYTQRVKEAVSSAVLKTIDSIDSVGTIFHEVIESFHDTKYDSSDAVFDATAEAVCKNCSLYRFCWQKDKSKTLSCTQRMYSVMESKNTISKKETPKEFLDMCIRSDAFLCELNKNYEAFKVTKMWSGKVQESKRLVAEQFKNISMVLKNAHASIAKEIDFIPEAERKIAAELSKRGISAEKISVHYRDGYTVTIEKLSCDSKSECDTIIPEIICDVLEVPMVKVPTDCNRAMCSVTFHQKTKLSADVATSATTKAGSAGSGDSFAVFPVDAGKIAIAVCDGMGSGDMASFQSNITVELSKKLLSAGFDKETCVRLINDILMANADKDTFSTIDLCIVNLHTGETEFIKTGSANSYLRLRDGFETVQASSLPAGMVRAIEPDLYTKELCAGDFVIMATDGVTDALELSDKDEILSLCTNFDGTAQELSDSILKRALELSNNTPTDDMTVAVCRLACMN